jgi:hypothetical protein
MHEAGAFGPLSNQDDQEEQAQEEGQHDRALFASQQAIITSFVGPLWAFLLCSLP